MLQNDSVEKGSRTGNYNPLHGEVGEDGGKIAMCYLGHKLFLWSSVTLTHQMRDSSDLFLKSESVCVCTCESFPGKEDEGKMDKCISCL